MKPSMSAASLTRIRELQQNITLLASAEISEAPFVSCYLDLSQGETACRRFLDERSQELRESLSGDARADFEQALDLIEEYLDQTSLPQAQGVAVFARGPWGGRFFNAMQFAVPVANSLDVYPAPDIYPLLELNDTYDRYMLVLVRPEAVQAIEVNLGAASVRAWAANPRERVRAVRGGERADRFAADAPHLDPDDIHLEAQAYLIERLLHNSGRTHLILAGTAGLATRLRELLPVSVASRLIDVLHLPASASQQEAVERSLRCFVEFEERESRQITTRLLRRLKPGGLAVTGSLASLRALREGRADTLVIASGYRPEPGWVCGHCGEGEINAQAPQACPSCQRQQIQPLDLRAEMVRLAAQQGVAVEVVEAGDELRARGGVGCLLRSLAARRAQPAPETLDRLRLVA